MYYYTLANSVPICRRVNAVDNSKTMQWWSKYRINTDDVLTGQCAPSLRFPNSNEMPKLPLPMVDYHAKCDSAMPVWVWTVNRQLASSIGGWVQPLIVSSSRNFIVYDAQHAWKICGNADRHPETFIGKEDSASHTPCSWKRTHFILFFSYICSKGVSIFGIRLPQLTFDTIASNQVAHHCTTVTTLLSEKATMQNHGCNTPSAAVELYFSQTVKCSNTFTTIIL